MTIKKLKSIDIINVLSDLVSDKLKSTVKLPALVVFKNSGRNFTLENIEKRDILELYKDDIIKDAKRYNSRVSAIFENIPAYLSTHEKRIVLS